MPDGVCVARTVPQSRRSSAIRAAHGTVDPPVSKPGNGNGHAVRDEQLLADDPLRLSPRTGKHDPARRAAVEMGSAMMVASSAETPSHAADVDVTGEAICPRLGLSDGEIEEIVIGARLHDVGK